MVNYRIIKIPDFHSSMIGPTPNTWQNNLVKNNTALRLEKKILEKLKSIGKPFGWTTQQRGKIIHDVITDPFKSNSQSQIGSNCDVELTLHTEDGFALNKPDYIALFCLRNEEKTPTIVSDIDDIEIHEISYYHTLFQEIITINPDETHLDSNHLYCGPKKPRIKKPIIDKKITTLKKYGDELQLTYDPAYTQGLSNPKLLLAYSELTELLKAKSKEIILETGDLLIINNHKIVHGRGKFKCNNNQQKRWLKRILIKK